MKEDRFWVLEEKLDQVIAEQKGIVDGMFLVVGDVLGKIEQEIKNADKTRGDGFVYKKGLIKGYDYKGRFDIEWDYYNCDNRDVFDILTRNNGSNAQWYNSSNTLKVTLYALSGRLRTDITFESIQHELEHMYQARMGNPWFVPNKRTRTHNPKSTSLYYVAANNMGHKNRLVSLVATVIYFSFEIEQEAYANGAYARMMECGRNIRHEARNTSMWLAISELEEALEMFENNRFDKFLGQIIEQYNEAIGDCRISKQWLIKTANKNIKDMRWRLGRAVIQATEDSRSFPSPSPIVNYN